MDYAEVYTIAMEYFAPKREALAHLLAEDITRTITPNKSVSLADIGAGDGTMMADILEGIPSNLRQGLDLTYIEPDKSNFEELQKTFNRLAGLTGVCRIVEATLEEQIQREPHRLMDIFTMTHVLYHLPRAQWKPFLKDVFNATAQDGVGYITLIDASSDVYKLSGLSAEQEGLRKDTFGNYSFAHHLRETLEKMPGIGFTATTSPAYYKVPQADIDAFCNTDDSSSLARTRLAAFLGFVLRLPPEEIAQNRPLVKNFREHLKSGKPLCSSETVFRVFKKNPQISH